MLVTLALKRVANKIGSYFFKLAECSQDVFWIRSPCFQSQLYVNPAYEKIWCKDIQSLYDNPSEWINAVVLEDRDRLRQQLMEFQASDKINGMYVAHYRIASKKGEIRWIKDTGFSIYDGRHCVGYVGVAQEVTHCGHDSKEFGDPSEFFKFFVEKIRNVFWVKDSDGKKQIYISPAYEKIWGRTCDSLYQNSNSWLDAVLPEDIENKQIYKNCFHLCHYNIEKPGRYQFRIQRPDGVIRWIKDTHFPIKKEDKLIGFAGIAEDITEDVLREKELCEAKENAEKANRAKSDFLAMMSHELRTPLNAILGMAQILKTSQLAEEQVDQVQVIERAGQSLLSLLNDLLDFAKLEGGKLLFSKDSIFLRELVEKLINDKLPEATEKTLEFRLEYAFNVPSKVVGDEKRVRQILMNLISNAIKFTSSGHVKITVSCLEKNGRRAIISFVVEDTGIGIKKSNLHAIFDRFQQIDSVYQRKHDGVGLGLSIVKELVEKMGGNIAVASEVGVGSQFTCTIPFELDQSDLVVNQRISESPEVNCQQPTQKINDVLFGLEVLIVEDNVINQKISKILLEQLGCHVDIADCAEVALKKVKKKYDLIFMDIGLPDMDGFETVEKIRAGEIDGQRVPIVAMTAHVFAHDRERCFDVGMDGVIAKPVMREDLITVLKCYRDKKQINPSLNGGGRLLV